MQEDVLVPYLRERRRELHMRRHVTNPGDTGVDLARLPCLLNKVIMRHDVKG